VGERLAGKAFIGLEDMCRVDGLGESDGSTNENKELVDMSKDNFG